MNRSKDELLRALDFISSDDRLLWIKIGAILKGEFGEEGKTIWDNWSRKSSKFKEGDTDKQWKFLDPKKVSTGTLFREALNNGFRYNNENNKPIIDNKILEERKREIELQRKNEEKNKLLRQKEAAKNAENRWNNSKELNLNHPYLEKKSLNNLSFLKRIIKQDNKNNLIIPIKEYGKFTGVQRITYDGSKFLEKDMKLDGSSLIIGSWDRAKERGIFLFEGFATAVSSYISNSETTMIAFTGNNIISLAKKLKESTNMKVYIGADIDENGLKFAEKAKEILGDRAIIIKPKFTNDDVEIFKNKTGSIPKDFNDLFVLKGKEEVKKQIDEALVSFKNESSKVFFKKTLNEINNLEKIKGNISNNENIKRQLWLE